MTPRTDPCTGDPLTCFWVHLQLGDSDVCAPTMPDDVHDQYVEWTETQLWPRSGHCAGRWTKVRAIRIEEGRIVLMGDTDPDGKRRWCSITTAPPPPLPVMQYLFERRGNKW